MDINFGLKSCENLAVLKKIEKLNQKIEVKNIQLNKTKSKTEELFHKKIIYQLQGMLKMQIEKYTKSYKSENIYRAVSNEKQSFYDQIRDVYITFMSMETKTYALNWIFR